VTESTWAAIVVNYEAGDLLIDCVRSILADESAGKPELVVVDNGSGDNSVASLRASLPGVQIVDAPGNVGYARAPNPQSGRHRLPVGASRAVNRRSSGPRRAGPVVAH